MQYYRSTLLGATIVPDADVKLTTHADRICVVINSFAGVSFHLRLNGAISFEVFHAEDESLGRIDALLLTNRPFDPNAITFNQYLIRIAELVDAIRRSSNPTSAADVLDAGGE
jgi:hypothetical protein